MKLHSAKRPYGKAFFAKLFCASTLYPLRVKKRGGPACNAGAFLATSLCTQRSSMKDKNQIEICNEQFSHRFIDKQSTSSSIAKQSEQRTLQYRWRRSQIRDTKAAAPMQSVLRAQ